MKYLISLLITIFLFISCTIKTGKHAPDYSRSIDQLYQKFSTAYQTKDLDLVSNLYAEDAHYIPGSSQMAILDGGQKIRNTFASYFERSAAGVRDLDISFRILKRQINDSLAYDVGYYLIRSKNQEEEEFPEGGSVGKFVTVIGLQPNGSWKFLLDGFSPAPSDAFPAESVAHNPIVQKN